MFISFTYVAGQMRGVGVVFSRFLEVDINEGVIIGMCIVFVYAALGGMKGITWTQVCQYCVLIVAYIIPAVAISSNITGIPIPQIGFGSTIEGGAGAGKYLLDTLNLISKDLGFIEYTKPFVGAGRDMLNVFCITFALMVGTAGLPHVIIRFYTVPKARDARVSAGWALLFIAILYTTAPAVAAFARYNMIETINEKAYKAISTAKADEPPGGTKTGRTPTLWPGWTRTRTARFSTGPEPPLRDVRCWSAARPAPTASLSTAIS